jgi:diphosphomevalonate decarboxylase
MKKVTAEAPANLAFVKYWGKKNAEFRLPTNNSLSVNLSNAKTTTTVEFDPSYLEDEITVVGDNSGKAGEFNKRIITHLDRIRSMAGVATKAKVTTQNSFPSSVGIASSASGFAALTTAATAALELELNSQELSALARLGSGSACRSIPDGFTEWVAGNNDQDSYAIQVAGPDYWDLRIVTVVVSKKAKKLSSTDGHSLAMASPFFETRLDTMQKRLDTVRGAILDRDFTLFGQQSEMEAISFHIIAMTSPIQTDQGWLSGAYYWLPESLALMLGVQEQRQQGLEVYFTLDAGPTVHLLCLEKDLQKVINFVKELEQTEPQRKWDIHINAPAIGARIIG